MESSNIVALVIISMALSATGYVLTAEGGGYSLASRLYGHDMEENNGQSGLLKRPLKRVFHSTRTRESTSATVVDTFHNEQEQCCSKYIGEKKINLPPRSSLKSPK